jgi:hypothetical protein
MRNRGIVLARAVVGIFAISTCMGLLQGAFIMLGRPPEWTSTVNPLGFALGLLLVYAATRTISPAIP